MKWFCVPLIEECVSGKWCVVWDNWCCPWLMLMDYKSDISKFTQKTQKDTSMKDFKQGKFWYIKLCCRSKSCKKDLWTQINAALQNNSKWQRLDSVSSEGVVPALSAPCSTQSRPYIQGKRPYWGLNTVTNIYPMQVAETRWKSPTSFSFLVCWKFNFWPFSSHVFLLANSFEKIPRTFSSKNFV